MLLYPCRDELHLALTQRTDTLPNHKGQVSLPGGAWEPGESFAQTALREAQEELGIDPAQVQIIGGLTALFIPPSRYCIHPIVGYVAIQPTFQPDPHEVAEVLEVPLANLIDPAVVREELWSWEGLDMYVPIYNLNDHKVWGATAMVLAEFVELIEMALRKDG